MQDVYIFFSYLAVVTNPSKDSWIPDLDWLQKLNHFWVRPNSASGKSFMQICP